MTKTPEQWLEEAAPASKKIGVFKLFLGYAPGVGKTHTMLTEAIRRKSRGEDVVIGVIETHGRKAVGELVTQLEIVPRKAIEYKGAQFEEMDVDAILVRNPRVALVDELAHTNIEGSKHRKRYEDVFELLDAGIDVLSTMNIQHLESVTPTVQGVTGIQVRETVPDWVLQRVNEVVMIDLTPEALQNRMRRGDVYPQERVGRALENFFRETNLIALRELALRQVAQAVDHTLEQRREVLDKDRTAVAIRERIAVCISSNPAAQYLIARGARMSQAMNAELFVVYTDLGQDKSEENQRTLNANIRFAENVGAKLARLQGKSVAEAVAEFVNEKHITQVVFGRSATRGWKRYFYLSAIHQFLRDAPAVDVHIVTQERADALMAEPKHILVVDDESQITRVLRTTLSSHGYDIRVANDGETALEIMKEWKPDLVITDLAMPNMDGLELCRRLRTKTQVPIIVLSVRGEERTKVKALDAGADDYVTKPFGMEELLARVRANLRRERADESEAAPITLGDFRIDPGARSVHVKDRAVHLTPKEFDLLLYLARHPGKVITHRALLGAVWGGESVEQIEYLRVFVGQLRKKLEPAKDSPRYIVTDPWVGYRFEPGT